MNAIGRRAALGRQRAEGLAQPVGVRPDEPRVIMEDAQLLHDRADGPTSAARAVEVLEYWRHPEYELYAEVTKASARRMPSPAIAQARRRQGMPVRLPQ